MTEMIERVARALCACEARRTEEGIPGPRADQSTTELEWHTFTMAALAVLEALREPTEAMSLAGAEFFEEETAKQNRFAAAIVYGAMIEAALDDERHGAT